MINLLSGFLAICIKRTFLYFSRELWLPIQRASRNLFLLSFLAFEGVIASENSELFVWDIDVDGLCSQSEKNILTETDLLFIDHSSPLSAYAYLGLMYELGEISDNLAPNLSKALAIYTHLLKTSPDAPDINLVKIAAARVYVKLDRCDDAINILTCENESILDIPSSYIILGDIYSKRGDLQTALACWRKAWYLNPFTGEINERLILCHQLGVSFISSDEYDINLHADSYNRWLFLKNEAYTHISYHRIADTEDKHWIMYELLTDASRGLPNAMLILADFYQNGTPHFKANSSLAEKWLAYHKSIIDNNMQPSWHIVRDTLFHNIDLSLYSLNEIKNIILWPNYPKQERGYFFPTGQLTDSVWEFKKLFLLIESEAEYYYSTDEDIKLQLKLLSESKEEIKQIINKIDLNKCSMQTLYIMFDQFNNLEAAKTLLKRTRSTVTILKMEILTESPGILISSCLQEKLNENIPTETEKVIKKIYIGHPLYMMPQKLKTYWEKFDSNYHFVIE